MRWGFIVDITNLKGLNAVTKEVKSQAIQAVSTLPSRPEDLYRVEITFYQSQDRYRVDDQEKPREDRGDIDNLVKHVFDGLGPIIGFRREWKKISGQLKPFKSTKPEDSKIIELVAKKVNSGSKNEFVSVEIETV